MMMTVIVPKKIQIQKLKTKIVLRKYKKNQNPNQNHYQSFNNRNNRKKNLLNNFRRQNHQNCQKS